MPAGVSLTDRTGDKLTVPAVLEHAGVSVVEVGEWLMVVRRRRVVDRGRAVEAPGRLRVALLPAAISLTIGLLIGAYSYRLFQATGRDGRSVEAPSLIVAVPAGTTAVSTRLMVDLLERDEDRTGVVLTVSTYSPKPVADPFIALWIDGGPRITWSETSRDDVLDHREWVHEDQRGQILRLVTTSSAVPDGGVVVSAQLIAWFDELLVEVRGERTLTRLPSLAAEYIATAWDAGPIVHTVDLTGDAPVVEPTLAYRSDKEIHALLVVGDDRVEFANPELADADILRWKVSSSPSEPETYLRPRVTLVDDVRAAQVENRIFLAGVWGGVAVALVVLAGERFPWRHVHAVVRRGRADRRWRRAMRRARAGPRQRFTARGRSTVAHREPRVDQRATGAEVAVRIPVEPLLQGRIARRRSVGGGCRTRLGGCRATSGLHDHEVML